jgi:hypothetical protein
MPEKQPATDQPGQDDARADPSAEENAAAEIKEISRLGVGIARDFLELLSVESRLAGRSLALMLAIAVALALSVVSAWLLLIGAIAFFLVGQGTITAPVALVLAGLGNVLTALIAWLIIRRLSHNLGFPGVREAAGGMLSKQSPAKKT